MGNINPVLITLVSVLPLMSEACFARTQSIAVQGRLFCFGQPAIGTRLRLYDFDFPDKDDLLDSADVDRHGNFYLSGWTRELFTFDPVISIYHECNDEHVPCQNRVDLHIPKTAVTNGDRPEETYDIGKINLEGNFDGQTRDCID